MVRAKRPAADHFGDLEAMYGADGSGMNFGPLLMPVISLAKTQLTSDVVLSDEELYEVLAAISNFKFLEVARTDRQQAAADLVSIVRRIAGP